MSAVAAPRKVVPDTTTKARRAAASALKPSPAPQQVIAPSPPGSDTNSAELASVHLGEAEAVIRAAAEAETGPTRGAALLAAALVTGLAKECIPLGVPVDRKALSEAASLLSQAEAVLELVTRDDDDLLADAGLTLLLAAQDLISSAEDEVRP
ncbi:hypothetical protein [Acidovorax sp. LjRoot117]|uniref:hypothetical protein n=1 Tax=Acidovorax sp. LjRoot117 TaxID=3342255 RepID=UPI003ECF553C